MFDCYAKTKENDLKRLNALKCKNPGPWIYISKSLKNYQQKLEVNVDCFYFLASNGHEYQTREGKTLKYNVKHFAHYFSQLLSLFITLIVILLWLVVLELMNWRNFKKGSLSSSRAIRFAAIAIFIAVCRPTYNFAKNPGWNHYLIFTKQLGTLTSFWQQLWFILEHFLSFFAVV